MARPIVLAIPTLNEAQSIGVLLDTIPRNIVSTVLVADGGSTDGTCAIAERSGATVLDVGRGYGRACLKAALAAPTDAIMVFMDGDGADDPGAIGTLAAPIVAGTHDFVIGSRVSGTRDPGSMAWHQVAAGYLIGRAIGILYCTRYTDMCAFRAISRQTLLSLGMREMTYGWNLEMQMRAARAGLRILELPIHNRRRIAGTSKVAGSLRGSIRAGTRIVVTFLRVVSERFTRTQEAGS